MRVTKAKRAHLARILREAETRLDDSEILSGSESTSDSAYLLDLLAFELLLKAVCSIHGTKTRGHKYRGLFSALPLAARRRIKRLAAERMSTTADYSRLGALLDLYAKNFVNLRYPYERYELYTKRRYRRAGEQWVARGASVPRAHFRYRPSELHGLVFALVTEVRGWCEANPA